MIELKDESYAEWRSRIEREWWRDNWLPIFAIFVVVAVAFALGALFGFDMAMK